MRVEWRWLAAAAVLAGCRSGFLPLRGKFDVGRDPMVVFVGGDDAGDLFAQTPAGGPAIPITFSPVAELRPALSPDGGQVAFLRAGSLTDTMPAGVWVLNLLNGAEREIDLPKGISNPRRVGWTAGGQEIVIEAGERFYRAAAPPAAAPARPVTSAERAMAESALAVLLGKPAFARVIPCANGEDLCAVGDSGGPSLFARGAREAARWGDDSVAYLEEDRLVVRPLSAGHPRTVEWSSVPARPRQPTVFAGASDERR